MDFCIALGNGIQLKRHKMDGPLLISSKMALLSLRELKQRSQSIVKPGPMARLKSLKLLITYEFLTPHLWPYPCFLLPLPSQSYSTFSKNPVQRHKQQIPVGLSASFVLVCNFLKLRKPCPVTFLARHSWIPADGTLVQSAMPCLTWNSSICVRVDLGPHWCVYFSHTYLIHLMRQCQHKCCLCCGCEGLTPWKTMSSCTLCVSHFEMTPIKPL